MKAGSTVVLFVVGAVLLVVPVLSRAYVQSVVVDRDKGRVAEFYQRNTNAAVLPESLRPTEFTYAGYDWACLAVGAGLIGLGVVRSRGPARSTDADSFAAR